MSVKLTVIAAIIGSLATTTLVCCYTTNTNSNTTYKHRAKNDSCGSLDDIAFKVEQCAKPLMDIIQGTLDEWPKNSKEVEMLCLKFFWAEKCTRDVARRCAKGVHKSIISTLANSIQRTRKSECKVENYGSVIRTANCIQKNQNIAKMAVINATTKALIIEKQMPNLDKKLNAICCLVHDVENDIKSNFITKCEAETSQIIRYLRAILEDVIEIICRNLRCKNVFAGYQTPIGVDPNGLISSLMRTVFVLG